MSDVLWLNKPSILIHQKYIHEWYPTSQLGKNRNINAVTRFIILMTLIMTMYTMKVSYLISGIISIGLIYLISHKGKKEGMKNKKPIKSSDKPLHKNPFQNHLIGDDLTDETAPKSYENTAEINASVKQMIQEQNTSIDNIESKLFKDLGESFEFDRSMRQFYATANTSVPNDQAGFAEFCYGDMVSGKDGDNSALLKRTNHLHQQHL